MYSKRFLSYRGSIIYTITYLPILLLTLLQFALDCDYNQNKCFVCMVLNTQQKPIVATYSTVTHYTTESLKVIERVTKFGG